jgi:hypothetical protein
VYAIHSLHLQKKVREVKVRLSENQFLRAQDGLFTVDTEADAFYITHGEYPHLMESLFDLGGEPTAAYKPIKYVLPSSEAHELIRMLYLEKVTKAHLMPTLDNVAQTVVSKWQSILGKRESDMIDYQTVVDMADQLPLAEKARLIEHLSVALRTNLEVEAYQRMPWHEFIDRTAGSLADTPIERPEQPPLEAREPLE